jgi:BMFP domain-containing protein YqiC
MQNFECTAEEVEVLRDILQHNLSEIDIEVFRTDTHDFKEMLKRRRDTVEHLLAKLPAPTVSA